MFLSLDHKGIFTSLGARARLNFLESLEFKLLTDLRLSDLASNCIVCVDLCVGSTNGYEAVLFLLLDLLGDSETLLQIHLCFVPKLIHDDVVDRGLGSERATISMLL